MSEANQTINTSSVSDPAAAIRQLQLGVSGKAAHAAGRCLAAFPQAYTCYGSALAF